MSANTGLTRPLLLMFLFLFIQGTFLNSFDINGILPDFGLLYLLYLCFFTERYQGLSLAVVYGFLHASSGNIPPLLSIIPSVLLVLSLNLLSGFIDARNVTSWLLSCVVGTFFLSFMHYFFLAVSSDAEMYRLLRDMLFQLFYNLIMVTLFFPLLIALEKWGKGKSEPSRMEAG